MTEKNNHTSSALLSILRTSVSPDSLIQNIGDYYKDILPDSHFIIVSPGLAGKFLKTIFYRGDHETLFARLNTKINSLSLVSDLQKINIFSLFNLQNKPDYMFYFGSDINQIHNQINDEFKIFNIYYQTISSCFNQGQIENHHKCANLISHLTHDINSLLSLIDKPVTDDQREKKIGYVEHLLPQLLLLIRDMELIRVIVDVDDLLGSIIDTSEYSEQICLNSFDGNYNISCDVELMNLAFSAIFDNAIQFKQETKDKIRISVQILNNLPIFFKQDFMEINISDSGTGIPDEYLPLVFKPFFTTNKSGGHVGFGLAIVQKIIHAHGGYVEIFPNRDKGCCVSILLPLETK